MINLLFISDSSKVEFIKNELQAVLKIIIDIVPDFDRGLKDVFEKRPATVCIQDQISGVTGESVARHIQMLLGNGAPKFVLIHDGSSKAKQISGIFDYVVNLDQPEARLAEEIQNTLKILIGDQWDKILIPPSLKPDFSGFETILQEEPLEDDEKLVDAFFSDIGSIDLPSFDDVPVRQGELNVENGGTYIAQSASDSLAEMMLSQAHQARQDEIAAEKRLPVSAGQDFKSMEEAKSLETANLDVQNTSAQTEVSDKSPKSVRTRSTAAKLKKESAPAAGKAAEFQDDPPDTETDSGRVVSVSAVQPSPVSASDFLISHEKISKENQIQNDLLQTFDENYRARLNLKRRLIAYLIILISLLLAVGWCLIKLNPGLVKSVKKQLIPVSKPIPAPTIYPALPSVNPMPVDARTAQEKVEKAAVSSAVPTFIPRDGHDKSFAAKNPGWERYVGLQHDYRMFKSGGKLKAMQILAVEGNEIPEALVKNVLIELAGSSDYQINTREKKSGVLMLRGNIANKGDLLFYKKGPALLAFVVSLE